MKPFKAFLKTLNKKYVCLQFDSESNKKLKEYAEANGYDLSVKFNGDKQDPSDFDFHVTIFFTTSEHDTATGEYQIKPFDVSFTGFDLFGENKDVAVLKVKVGKELSAIRNRFEMMGYKDSWGEYKPHVTLSYDKSEKNADIKLPDFTVKAVKIIIENQKSS